MHARLYLCRMSSIWLIFYLLFRVALLHKPGTQVAWF